MDKKNPTQHSMNRRSAAHDYTRTGIYHVTIHVADCLGQVLGTVVGSLSASGGSADAPHTALSPIGQMVEQELTTSISFYGHLEHIKYLDSKNLAASTKSTNIPKKIFEI